MAHVPVIGTSSLPQNAQLQTVRMRSSSATDKLDYCSRVPLSLQIETIYGNLLCDLTFELCT